MKLSNLALTLVSLALLATGATALNAQTVYRIVGPDGKLTFSDKAPADLSKATAASGAGKPLPAAAGETGVPYELRQVMGRYPVTLYAGASCGPCNSGRQLLQSRGVPFVEYTVATSEDVEALQRLSGDNSLPFLVIGGQKIKGYSESEWGQYLTAANYPTRSMLPASYRSPPPKPLVALQRSPVEGQSPGQQAAADERTATNQPVPPAAPPAAVTTTDNPVGIKF